MLRWLIFLMFLGGCQATSAPQVSPAPKSGGNAAATSPAVSTVTPSNQCLYITNGIQTPQQTYPAIVLIATNTGLCTGTFVASNAVLTAAHCLNDNQTNGGAALDGLSVIINNRQIPATRAFFPKWAGDDNFQPYNDISILYFAQATAPAIMPVATTAPAVGAAYTIAGYGVLTADDQDGRTNRSSQLYRGANTVLAMVDDYIVGYGESGTGIATPAGQDSSGSFGDSGGPLIINGTVVGTESFGSGTLTLADFTQNPPFVDEEQRPLSLPNSQLSTIEQQVQSGRKLATDYHVNLTWPAYTAWLKSLTGYGIQVQFADPSSTTATVPTVSNVTGTSGSCTP